ncbi:MAG: hypothetical protein E7316_02335 [Clostridiales bacterium]|nr:hypothetical protein [Clostridiales bacterium]
MNKLGWEYEALFDVDGPTELERAFQAFPTEIRVGKMGYRVKTVKAGQQLDVDVYPLFGREQAGVARRAAKRVTREAQQRINKRNAERRIVQLVNTNFTEKDIALHLTYEDAPDYDQCQRDVRNFLRRVKRLRKKQGLPEMKYIYVVEDDEFGVKKRIHAHVVMSGGIPREELEKLWARGYANADRLQLNEQGLEGLARYMVKSQRNRKKWCCSRNLKEPQVRVSDCKLSNARVKRIARGLPNEAKEILRKVYPGYEYVDCEVRYSDMVDGVMIRARMRRMAREVA